MKTTSWVIVSVVCGVELVSLPYASKWMAISDAARGCARGAWSVRPYRAVVANDVVAASSVSS